MSDTLKPYCVIQLAGKQYTAEEGTVLTVNKLDLDEGANLDVTDVLLYADGKQQLIGTPLVKDAKVTLKSLKNLRGDKIRVATYKAKSRYRRVKGHRQELTQLEVVKISVK
jgi:large subunit ribosomal protein L21